MHHIDTLVIGAGHAGLAMSRSLTDRGLDHIVLERGRLGRAVAHERWDSLRLLTPNWMTRLPGWSYDGNDPDGYMRPCGHRGRRLPRAVCHLVRARRSSSRPPSRRCSRSASVRRHDRPGHAGAPDRWSWPPALRPAARARLRAGLEPLGAPDHARRVPQPVRAPRRRGARRRGRRIGVQIADELARAGRDVVLAVGRHSRMPRRLPRQGHLVVARAARAPWTRPLTRCATRSMPVREPSLQLAGRRDSGELNLAALQACRCSNGWPPDRDPGEHGPLRRATSPRRRPRAEARMRRVLARIDATVAAAAGRRGDAESSSRTWPRSAPVRVVPGPRRLDPVRPSRSAPWSGPPAFVARTPGCGCPSWTPPARYATATGSPRSRGCTSSAALPAPAPLEPHRRRSARRRVAHRPHREPVPRHQLAV